MTKSSFFATIEAIIRQCLIRNIGLCEGCGDPLIIFDQRHGQSMENNDGEFCEFCYLARTWLRDLPFGKEKEKQ